MVRNGSEMKTKKQIMPKLGKYESTKHKPNKSCMAIAQTCFPQFVDISADDCVSRSGNFDLKVFHQYLILKGKVRMFTYFSYLVIPFISVVSSLVPKKL